MERRRLAAVAVCLILWALPVEAQLGETCQDVLRRYVDDIQATRKDPLQKLDTRLRQLLGSAETFGVCLATGEERLAQVIEIRRIDKQAGASGGTSGSTTLVSNGIAPRLLGLALEHGGVTQALSGSTVTFRTTPAKLVTALSKAYGPDAPMPDDKTLRALGRASVSASFDTSRTATADSPNGSPFLANYRQLSETSLRVQLWNDRDPLSRRNWTAIRTLSQGPAAKLYANEARDVLRLVKGSQGYDAAVNEAFKNISEAKDDESVRRALEAYIEKVKSLVRTVPGWDKRIMSMIDSWVKIDAEHKALYRKIAKAPLLAFEYAFDRPPVVRAEALTPPTTGSPPTAFMTMAPDHHTARLIFASSLLESEYTLTASATWFHEARPDMRGNFRNFQLGGKWDIPLGEIPPLARGTLTFSGLYMKLHQRPLGFDLKINDEKVNKAGSIGFFQGKYTIPLSDSGVSVPIAFTVSNRTELIKEREVRGNIGLTLDLDKLTARK